MNCLTVASEAFATSIVQCREAYEQERKRRYNFGVICETYKSILDSNFSGRFCFGRHCKTIYMVEIKYDGSKWGATPKMFYSEVEAKAEAEMLRQRYPWITELRIVTRKEKEKD